MNNLNRRNVLRGMLGGSAVIVGLPLLNCFLNGNGTALASGAPMPVRYGTWMWGLGLNKAIFVPKKVGLNYELPQEVECLKPIQSKMNIFTNYMSFRDSYNNQDHYSGWVTTRSGQAPAQREDRPGETLDVTVANKIGSATRFKMLTATATGDVRNTFSYEGQISVNPAEFSPVDFYLKLFGPGYQDPNAPSFSPDPSVMVRKSVLSGVMDDIKVINNRAGAEDKQRLDQYFSGLRELEHQFNIRLTKPEPIAACGHAKAALQDPGVGVETGVLAERHNLMTDLMVMAIACDQTRVFNMFYSGAQAVTVKKGYDKPHHTLTHEEGIDEKLGYQPMVSWFTQRAMENWLYFVQAFDKIKEGDGTVLDNTMLYAHSDQGLARVHSLDGMAMFTAGRAGGKIKNGYHIAGNGDTVARVGYTTMRAVGVDLPRWGTKSNTVSDPVSEIVV